MKIKTLEKIDYFLSLFSSSLSDCDTEWAQKDQAAIEILIREIKEEIKKRRAKNERNKKRTYP